MKNLGMTSKTLAVLVLIALGFYAAVFLKAVAAGDGSNPHLFFHPDNIANILGQAAIVGILACGMTLVIVSGHIDLSVGSMLGMLGAVAAWLLKNGPGWPDGAFVGLVILIGAAAGLAQGVLIARARIPAFVVTLGGFLVFRGVLLLVAKSTIPIDSKLVNGLGSEAFLGIPIRFIAMAILALTVHILATRFRFGRRLFAIGGNREAARFSGIDVEFHIIAVYAFMGAVASLAGLVSSGIQMAADAGAGDLMELYAIAACVIGGTSLSGGKGSVAGSILGALVMATIRNGLSCLGVPSAGEKIILGLILILAVGIDSALSRTRKHS